MDFSFMRIDGRLHWFVNIPSEVFGISYPVFHRGSLRLLLSVLFCAIFRRDLYRHCGPSESDLKNAKSLQEWYDSLPPDPTKPLHDILDS